MTVQPAAAEIEFIRRLAARDRDGQRITLLVGAGLGDPDAPRAADVINLADRYAEGRNDDGDLGEALRQVRDGPAGRNPALLYREYRRILADWLSADEFDAIAQQSVLQRYQPQDLLATPLGSHGFWQPITLHLGDDLDNDLDSLQL